MIDLKAIETRCKEIDALKAKHPWMWAQSVQITPVLRDRTELVTEVKRLRALSKQEDVSSLSCGHPRGCLVQDAEGTAHCAWCEEVARLRQSLAKQIHKRQSEVAEALLARDEVDGTIAEWYDECQSEIERLREELERLRGDDGHPHESGDQCMACERLATKRGWPYCNQCLLEGQLEFCNETTTEAITKVGQLHEELKRAAARVAALVEAANTLVQRLATINLHASGAVALGNALAYGPEVTVLQDVLELEGSSD